MGQGLQLAGASDALWELVAQRNAAQIAAQQHAEKMRQQQTENEQQSRRIAQGDRNLDLTERGMSVKETPHPMDLGPGHSVFDPIQGRILTTAPMPEKPAAAHGPMNVAPGGTVFDPAKGVLYTSPFKPEKQAQERPPHRVVQQGIDAQGNPTLLSVDLDSGQATPVQMPNGVQPNRPAKPVTGAERQTLAFYNRMKDALANIESGDQGQTLEDLIASQGTLGQIQGQFAPNMLQNTNQQKYRQSQRAYTEARLRKESGAAIPESEFQNDARTYFVQPGDAPDVVKQKRLSRKTVLEGLRNASGRAYQEFYGEQGGQPTQGGGDHPPLQKYGATYTWDGSKYVRQ
jgi:hypothetical protein